MWLMGFEFGCWYESSVQKCGCTQHGRYSRPAFLHGMATPTIANAFDSPRCGRTDVLRQCVRRTRHRTHVWTAFDANYLISCWECWVFISTANMPGVHLILRTNYHSLPVGPLYFIPRLLSLVIAASHRPYQVCIIQYSIISSRIDQEVTDWQ